MWLSLLSLFFACFLAATVVPFSSELIYSSAILLSDIHPLILLLIATIGNTCGGLTGYWLGFLGKLSWLSRYFGVKAPQIDKWQVRVEKYSYWLALLCWLPFIGDLIGIVLGFFKAKFWPVAGFMLLGKLLRYAVITWLLLFAGT